MITVKIILSFLSNNNDQTFRLLRRNGGPRVPCPRRWPAIHPAALPAYAALIRSMVEWLSLYTEFTWVRFTQIFDMKDEWSVESERLDYISKFQLRVFIASTAEEFHPLSVLNGKWCLALNVWWVRVSDRGNLSGVSVALIGSQSLLGKFIFSQTVVYDRYKCPW